MADQFAVFGALASHHHASCHVHTPRQHLDAIGTCVRARGSGGGEGADGGGLFCFCVLALRTRPCRLVSSSEASRGRRDRPV